MSETLSSIAVSAGLRLRQTGTDTNDTFDTFDIFVTRDTSHRERSPLNAFACMNVSLISVTDDTSQSLIGPCAPLEQSPVGDTSRHATKTFFRSALDCGENAVVGAGGAVGLSSD